MTLDQRKFYLKNGDLTWYAFLCGYIQEFNHFDYEIKLEMDCSCFHIKVYKNNDMIAWLSFTQKLTIARYAFKHIINRCKKFTEEEFKQYLETYPEV